MIKTISLLHARADMLHAAFVQRYEYAHVPLVNDLLGPFAGYRRDYVDPDSSTTFARLGAGVAAPDFDVMTTIRHENMEALNRLGDKLAEGDLRRRITEDEEHMFERRKTSMFLVDERRIAGPTAAAQNTRSDVIKLVLVGTMGFEEQDFDRNVAACDDACQLLVARFAGFGLCGLVRNSIAPEGVFDLRHIESHEGQVDFNLVLEIAFARLDGCQQFVTQARSEGASDLAFLCPNRSSGQIVAFLADGHGSAG